MRKRNFVMRGRRPEPIRPNRQTDLGPWGRALLPEPSSWDLAAYRPLSDWYRVQLLPKAEKSAGGVWLPDTVRMNWTDARVMASGPGQRLADDKRSVMWADIDDRVLFMKHSLKNLQVATGEGMVRDQDLIAVARVDKPQIPEPLNGWCLVQPAPAETHATAAIIWAEEDRPRPLHGLLLDFGPGEVRLKGPLVGTRKPVGEIMGFTSEDGAENMLGRARVYWDRECPALAIGRRDLEYILIQAADLWGYRMIEQE